MVLRQAAAEATAGRNDAVLHAHWWIPAGLAVPPGRRFVLTSHGTDVRLLERWALARWLARPVYQRAAVVTAVSSHLAEQIGRFTGRSVPPDRVQPMPVDTSHWGFSPGGGGLIAVARLTEQKRLHLLIGAIVSLKGRGITLPCTIVGDGPARRGLEQQARAEGASRVLLEVSAVNSAALAFYADTDFVEIDRRRRYYRDGSDAVVMRRSLGRAACGGRG